MKTEFIADENMIAHLYVDGQKTNTWYPLPENKYYDLNVHSNIEEKKLAETIKGLIDSGKITAKTWVNWDLYEHIKYKINTLDILPDDKRMDHANQILSCRGYEDYTSADAQKAIIDQYTGKTVDTQWSKRLIGDTIADKVAIKFYQRGYSLGFVV